MEDFLFRYTVLDHAVVDGDTVDLTLDLGFRIAVRDRFRLYGPDPTGSFGLDAPELSTPEGKEAKDWLAARLSGHSLVVRTVKDRREKFGRPLAVLYALSAEDRIWKNVNAELLTAGHADSKKY